MRTVHGTNYGQNHTHTLKQRRSRKRRGELVGVQTCRCVNTKYGGGGTVVRFHLDFICAKVLVA